MANVIGDLLIKIQADVSGVQQGVGKLQGAFNSLNKVAGGLLPAISVAAVVTGFATMMEKAAAYGETIGLVAEKTGLSVEMVQSLKFAADTSGASVESLNVGVKKLSTVLSEAFSGGKAAVQSIEELGLSVEDLQKMNPDQRVMAIFNAIAKIPDVTNRSAAAVKFLGRSGPELLPLINNVDALVKRFADMHIALNKDDIKSLQDGKTALEEMAISWELLQAKFAATVWPNLQPLLEALTQLINFTNQAYAALQELNNATAGASDVIGRILFPQVQVFAPHTVTKHAEGGIISSPQIGMIGEAGPEAIIPLSKMGGMGGTNVTIQAGAFMGSREDARNFARMIQEIMRNENNTRTYGRLV